MDISHAGWTVAAFEIAGIAGMLAAGWATDRFFGGRAPRTCVICMLMTALCLVGLYTLNEHTPLAVAIAILMSAGFFIYGPQALIGIAAANIATKRPVRLRQYDRLGLGDGYAGAVHRLERSALHAGRHGACRHGGLRRRMEGQAERLRRLTQF